MTDPRQVRSIRIGGRLRPRAMAALVLVALLAMLGGPAPFGPGRVGAAARDSVTIVGGNPVTLDPAVQGDLGSAQVTAQLFETLTAVDPALNVRPALASAWVASCLLYTSPSP